MIIGRIDVYPMKNNKPEEDAYGQLIWTYYNGRDVFEIIERDDSYFDASSTPRIYLSSFEEWAPIEKKSNGIC